VKCKTSPDEPEHVGEEYLEATLNYIKDLFRTQVAETEVLEEDSPSILNMGLDESGWSKIPSFATQPSTSAESQPRGTSSIDKELEHWMKVMKKNFNISTDLDILEYWKTQEEQLPLLAKVARRFFAMPVSSASSERLFSAAGNVITSARTLLNTERAEQLIYIHENYWANEPSIKTWKLRSDQERGKERAATQNEPQPSTSQSQSQTPRTPKTPKGPPLSRALPFSRQDNPDSPDIISSDDD